MAENQARKQHRFGIPPRSSGPPTHQMQCEPSIEHVPLSRRLQPWEAQSKKQIPNGQECENDRNKQKDAAKEVFFECLHENPETLRRKSAFQQAAELQIPKSALHFNVEDSVMQNSDSITRCFSFVESQLRDSQAPRRHNRSPHL